jgi:ribosomal protein S27AE
LYDIQLGIIMSKFIKHIPCPRCGSKDNLGEYDNHYFCFGCKYYKTKDDLASLRSRMQESKSPSNVISSSINTVSELPQSAMKWLLSYGISLEEIANYNIEWSEDLGILVLLKSSSYWQGRNFKNIGPKYLSNGSKPLTIYGSGDTIVLVEDVLSAIKISRLQKFCSAPLLGSSLSSDFEKKLTEQYRNIYVWLDRDKAKNAIRIKNRLKGLGITSRAIVTPKDPKEYSTMEIEQWLKNK